MPGASDRAIREALDLVDAGEKTGVAVRTVAEDLDLSTAERNDLLDIVAYEVRDDE